MSALKKSVSCGRDLTCIPDLATALQQTGQAGFDFVTAPLVHPRFKREFFRGTPERAGPLTRSDLVIPGSEWSSLIVGKLSPWIHLDSPDQTLRKNSEKAFSEELCLALHLNVPAILLPLRSASCVNQARCLQQLLLSQHNHMFWIHVPMVSPRNDLEGVEPEEQKPAEETWEWWNKLRTLCCNSRKLGLALELSPTLPNISVLDRWCGEPIKVVVVPTDVFLTNRKGYPVLPRTHQALLHKLFKLNVQLLLSGACKVEYGIHSYEQYLNHLYQTQPIPSSMDSFAQGYDDYLQSPLQPLMDNLDSQTYEIFEKDPVKYAQYEKAISKALLDRVTEDQKEDVTTVVMVVGAGRGPLVDATLRAAKSSERLVVIYAVEKNPGAVVTLQSRQAEEWGSRVTVVSCDMRKWNAPEKADILVSELLGSFGDNELSPECLDGAQAFLKSDGISIPCSYTSYLAPISSPRLHMEVSFCKEKEKAYPFANFETPYVVRLRNANTLAYSQPCFTFTHPNKDVPIDNERYISLRFPVRMSATLHGFAGYFDTILYDDITLSINPKTHSEGMISWFPIFFPIKDPMYIPANSEIEVHIWRLCTEKKVWYEWCLTEPQTSCIHNPRGRSYWIGL